MKSLDQKSLINQLLINEMFFLGYIRDFLVDKQLMEFTEKINKNKIIEKKKEGISNQNQNYNYNYLNFDLTLAHPLTIMVIIFLILFSR